jgi:3-oxoacyl-[acyl-carrier-protein] synthase II
MPDKVVITGMGTVNPIGLSVKESWENAVNGVSGVGPITLFDPAEFLVKIACEVKNFDPERYLPAKEVRHQDRFQHFTAAASQEAIQDAGLELSKENPEKIGVIVSSSIGGIHSTSDNIHTLVNSGPRRLSPFAIPKMMPNGAAGLISIENGYQGPSFSIASACASGADGIGVAWMLIKLGFIDVAITGGSEADITEIGIAAFDRVGALSRAEGDHPTVPRPFDLNRDGFVMGEGAAVLVVEREDHARKRKADIYAELAGYAATADAYHITAPTEDGAGGARAIKAALNSAGLNAEEVGYINAHGTGTQLNDVSETKAIKTALGEAAFEVPISSTKSMTGHMIGATGALELVLCTKAIREAVLPPTINYQTPDPECDLDYIPNYAREIKITSALSNAFGFGGHNTVLVVKEYN